MLTTADIIDRLRSPGALRAFRRAGCASAFLFGSVARGTANRDSDVDVLVRPDVGNPPSLGQLGRLKDELETMTGGFCVDLVIPSEKRSPEFLAAIQDDLIRLA